MPKNSSSKATKPIPEKPDVEQDKPCSRPKMFGCEIDEIFSSKKRKKLEQGKATEVAEDIAQKPHKLKKNKTIDRSLKDSESLAPNRKESKSKHANTTVFVDPPSRPRKKTVDGLAIYTEEELRFGKADAGGTRLCPFDCDCCF